MTTNHAFIRCRSEYFLGAAGICFVLACSAPARGQDPGAAADFLLPDVNANSASFQSQVSPRDYLQQVSGWYFGHAT
jgi:hypothetical protein